MSVHIPDSPAHINNDDRSDCVPPFKSLYLPLHELNVSTDLEINCIQVNNTNEIASVNFCNVSPQDYTLTETSMAT